MESQSDDRLEIDETGNVPNAATPSDQGEREIRPQKSHHQKHNEKTPVARPPSYTAEYTDPDTGKVVRKLVIASPPPKALSCQETARISHHTKQTPQCK